MRPNCAGCACNEQQSRSVRAEPVEALRQAQGEREPAVKGTRTMSITRFAFPTTIHFGAGARKLAGPRLHELGLRRPLIVTAKGLAELPLIAELKAHLEAAKLDVAVFGGVFGNPSARPG